MLSQQHVQNDAIDLVVETVVSNNTNLLAWLTVSVNATLTLFMSRWVPTEVVMHHGVKVPLQVDALGKAVRRDEHMLGRFGELIDARLALRWSKLARDSHDRNVFRKFVAQRGGNIFCRRDEAAENDGPEAFLQKRRNHRRGRLKFVVLLAAKRVSLSRHLK